jgi:SAM-dependent methyltransferase
MRRRGADTRETEGVTAGRPFYSEFGWAYDLLVADPVDPWVEVVEQALRHRGIGLPGRLLDAGCGTGRHGAAFAARGHDVVLLEPAPELLAQARERVPGADALAATLAEAPLLDPPADAATCRGVLNDLVEDRDRDRALVALAAAVRPGGALVLDVRDRDATAARYTPSRSVRREADGLTFTAHGRWDDVAGLVRVSERHEARGRVAEHDFVMRPWTEAELRERLERAGWRDVEVGEGRESRLLAVATLPSS